MKIMRPTISQLNEVINKKFAFGNEASKNLALVSNATIY